MNMKKLFVLLTQFCIVLFLFSCSNDEKQLLGKWQKSDSPDVIIEFKEGGVYEISVKGETLPATKYLYSPDAKENNLQIGEDTLMLKGNVEFVQKDKIRIRANTINEVCEYKRVI